MLKESELQALEWASFAIAGACAAYFLVGAVYVWPRVSQATFNDIWRTRLALQVASLLLALAQWLPLQSLWDPHHGAVPFLPNDFPMRLLCKLYMVASLGVFQPLLVFLAGFIFRFALRDPLHKPKFWQLPVPLAFLCMLPFTAGQILSAWWSTWLESTLDDKGEISTLPFSSQTTLVCLSVEVDTGASVSSDRAGEADICTSCKFTFSSLIVLVVLLLAFVLCVVAFGRALLRQCANKMLRRRVLLLCIALPALLLLQTTAAAVSLKSDAYTWLHEGAKFVAVLCVLAFATAMSTLLVILPLLSARAAVQMLPVVKSKPASVTHSVTRHSERASLLQDGSSATAASDSPTSCQPSSHVYEAHTPLERPHTPPPLMPADAPPATGVAEGVRGFHASMSPVPVLDARDFDVSEASGDDLHIELVVGVNESYQRA